MLHFNFTDYTTQWPSCSVTLTGIPPLSPVEDNCLQNRHNDYISKVALYSILFWALLSLVSDVCGHT